MNDDIVRRKGYLTLGSRLKRISDRLQTEVQNLMDQNNVPIQAFQYPLLASIDENGPMEIGVLATTLGVSQPGVTRSVARLAEQGFVDLTRGTTDRRSRVVSLTEAGRNVVTHGRVDIWPRIEQCLDAIITDRPGSLLEHLNRLEDGLQEKSFVSRVAEEEQEATADAHPLDRPVWASLSSVHRSLSVGSADALRFQDEINPFAAAPDESPESMAALGDLLRTAGTLVLAQRPVPKCPANGRITGEHVALQMIYDGPPLPQKNDIQMEPLGPEDVPAMVELATLTNPGPFARRSHELGQFWGVKSGGRLVAMGGERMKSPGYVELSGICTHPDFLGRGYAAALCTRIINDILDRGDTPYLHVFADNTRAIAVYEALGFRTRARINVVALEYARIPSTKPS